MTNVLQVLLTVVTMTVTNQSESDNHKGCTTCDGIMKNHWALYHECTIPGPYIPATERYVMTVVKDLTTYSFQVGKEMKSLTEEKVKSSITETLVLSLTWEKKSLVTNQLENQIKGWFLTNGVGLWGGTNFWVSNITEGRIIVISNKVVK